MLCEWCGVCGEAVPFKMLKYHSKSIYGVYMLSIVIRAWVQWAVVVVVGHMHCKITDRPAFCGIRPRPIPRRRGGRGKGGEGVGCRGRGCSGRGGWDDRGRRSGDGDVVVVAVMFIAVACGIFAGGFVAVGGANAAHTPFQLPFFRRPYILKISSLTENLQMILCT